VILSVHELTEDKIDDMKDSLTQFLKHHMIFLEDLNARIRRADISKPITSNESLH
jgi:hypothetical protein